jgi:hypothetical protein
MGLAQEFNRAPRWVGLLLCLLCAYGIYECLSAAAAYLTGEATGRYRYPLWGLVHFGSAAAFAALVPIQICAGFRRRFPELHRLGGRFAFAAASVMVSSGLALSLAMPRPLPVRVFFAVVFVAFISFATLGFRAARAHDFARHRQWAARMTATALAALTQRLISPLFLSQGFKNPDEFWSLFLTGAWVALALNLAATEWWLARGVSQKLLPGAPSASVVVARRESPLGAA